MPGTFRMNRAYLERVYGGGFPDAMQFLSLQRALPLVNVGRLDVQYWKDPVGELTPRGLDYTRAEGATFKAVSTEATIATTSLPEKALEARTDRRRASAADYPDVRGQKQRKVFFEILGNVEADLVTFMETSGNFGTEAAATALSGQWDSDSSDPLKDAAIQVRGIRTATGGIGGMVHMAITEAQRDALVRHARVRDAIKYTGGVVGDAELASYFRSVGIDRMHVKKSVKSSTVDPVAFAGARFFGDNAEFWVAQDESGVVNDGSWGKLFWYVPSAIAGLAAQPPFSGLPFVSMEMGYREEIDSDIDRARANYKFELTNSAAARRITDCLS